MSNSNALIYNWHNNSCPAQHNIIVNNKINYNILIKNVMKVPLSIKASSIKWKYQKGYRRDSFYKKEENFLKSRE